MAKLKFGELTSPKLQAMNDWNARKEKKYKEQLVPKMNRPASVLAFEVGQLGETNKSLHIFLASLGLRKSFCKTLIKQVSVIALECSKDVSLSLT
jgi:hypothetical protein